MSFTLAASDVLVSVDVIVAASLSRVLAATTAAALSRKLDVCLWSFVRMVEATFPMCNCAIVSIPAVSLLPLLIGTAQTESFENSVGMVGVFAPTAISSHLVFILLLFATLTVDCSEELLECICNLAVCWCDVLEFLESL